MARSRAWPSCLDSCARPTMGASSMSRPSPRRTTWRPAAWLWGRTPTIPTGTRCPGCSSCTAWRRIKRAASPSSSTASTRPRGCAPGARPVRAALQTRGAVPIPGCEVRSPGKGADHHRRSRRIGYRDPVQQSLGSRLRPPGRDHAGILRSLPAVRPVVARPGCGGHFPNGARRSVHRGQPAGASWAQ